VVSVLAGTEGEDGAAAVVLAQLLAVALAVAVALEVEGWKGLGLDGYEGCG
jgi:hypothetical protein